MKFMNALLLFCLLSACATAHDTVVKTEPAIATKTYDAVLHDYLLVTGTKENIVKTRQMVFEQMRQNIGRAMGDMIRKNHFEDQTQQVYAMSLINQALSNFTERMAAESERLMPFSDLEKNIIGPIFKKYFTKEDLETLTAFYNTPVGEKYVSHMDTLIQEIATETNRIYGSQLYNLSSRIARDEFEKIKWELESLDNK